MRLTFVADDRTIILDGETRVIETNPTTISGVHAIQWYGTEGEIEYKGKGQEYFTDANILEPYIAAFNAITPPTVAEPPVYEGIATTTGLEDV